MDKAILANFCQTLKTMQTRHTNVVQTMAQGVLELKESHTVDKQTDMAIQYFLDRFYMSRISMRMLIHQVKTTKSTRPTLTNTYLSTHFCLSWMLTRTPAG
jgi:hypothetical protein